MFSQWLFRSGPFIKSNDYLLRVRLWFFGVAWVHLIVVAIVVLPTDLSLDEDPKIRLYERLKWRFMTAWFNIINLAYFPLCLYCDWKEFKGHASEWRVLQLRRIRDIIFTSILFPTILCADLMFWRFYYKDLSLITPPDMFKYLSWWCQHSLHSVSLLVVILDLLFVPRTKPQSLKSSLVVMTTFFFIYVFVVFQSYLRGEMVYQVFAVLSVTGNVLLVVMAYTEYLLYFTVQWFIIERLWGKYYSNYMVVTR